jgi:restriction system protein
VETLRELGSSGTPSEVSDRVLDRLKISEQEQEETTSNGQSRVRNQIAWGRLYLAKAGYLDSSQRGVWSLTDTGRTAKFDPEAVHAMFKAVVKTFPRVEQADRDVGELGHMGGWGTNIQCVYSLSERTGTRGAVYST